MQTGVSGAGRITLFAKKEISLKIVWIVASLFTIISIWAYGHNYWAYVFATIFLMLYAYGMFFKKVFTRCDNLDVLFLILILFNLILGLINGDVIGSLMVNTSLAMIISLSDIDINYRDFEKTIHRAVFAVLIISAILMLIRSSWNLNSLALLIYSNSTIGFIWYKTARTNKQKLGAFALLVCLCLMLFVTETRNTAVVIIINVLLLLIPEKIYRNKFLFRLIYVIGILATIFAIPIMQFIFSNKKILGWLIDFTTKVSDKEYGMSSHLDILLRVQKDFASLDLVEKLFGQGVKLQHCHNIFYQTLFFYGYFGVALIYATYIYLFEIGYKLFTRNGDKLALSCCIIMVGHFLMQCAETYMLGSETVMITALLPASIILNLNRRDKKNAIKGV